ncbi:UvrABC system protein C [Frankliniella fusca]|uniref:UvrABC system protein C n=1 Tax=Frankliniella fusca TaxID=407009 RepID=A0AAE1LM26_9NEOP|nr:UvrABC system protein C [Frankliniella fusca]
MWVVVKELGYGRHEVIREERILRLSKELRIGYMYPYTPTKCHAIVLENLRNMSFSPTEYYNLLTRKEHLCVVLFVPESEDYEEVKLYLTSNKRKARELVVVDEAGECVHCLIEYLTSEQRAIKKRKVHETLSSMTSS